MKRSVFIIALMIIISVNASEIAGQFLLMPVGAKSFALANSVITSDIEPLAIFLNPANSSSYNATALTMGRSDYLLDTKFEYFAFCIPFSNYDTLGIGLNIFSTPPIDVYTWKYWDRVLDAFDVSMNSILLNYSRKFGDKMSFGLNFKFYREEIYTYKADTTLIDLGMKYRLNKGALGISVINLGKGIDFDVNNRRVTDQDYEIPTEVIPMIISFGGHYSPIKNLTMFLQGQIVAKEGFVFSGALEYFLIGAIPLRIGYTNKDTGELSFGTGASYVVTRLVENRKVDVIHLVFDYSYVPFGELGYTQHASVSFLFR